MLRLLTLLLLLAVSASVTAQDLFNVRVGTFKDVKASDFPNLQEIGFLYGAQRDGQLTDVYVGNFSTEAKATQIADRLKSQGFRNAQAFALPTTTGQPVTVIQIALNSNKKALDWAALERAGQLYVEAVDGVNKIVTGVYPNGQVALQFLPAIRDLGYTDAFVKQINNVRLIPVGLFETGIKKPLIPIELQQASAAATPANETTLAPAPAPASANAAAPSTYGSAATPTPYQAARGGNSPAPTPASATAPVSRTADIPVPANAAGLPSIDGKVKRHSAAELQTVLKEKGYYEGSIDGYYGPATTKAYMAAWEDLPELRKYRLLASNSFSGGESGNSAVRWPEVMVTMRIAEDIAAGLGNSDRAREMVQQRNNLLNADAALTPVAATRARNWASTVWSNLNDWAVEDPLHAQILTALRVSYEQSHVRLENMYMERGLGAIEARDLATAAMQNLIGAQLDRFL